MTSPSIPTKSRVEAAAEALRDHQTQLDEDGVMVGVSREALDIVLAELTAQAARFGREA